MGNVKLVIEWLLYIGIGGIAILFIYKGGAIEQYDTKATNFKDKEIPVTKRPAITICPKLSSHYKYGRDFNISIGSIIAKFGTNSIKCSNFLSEHDYQYDDCDYADDLGIAGISFDFEQVETLFSGRSCYKIVYDRKVTYDWKLPFQTLLIFGASIPFNELPENIYVYITSDANSHGIIYNTWVDGNELFFQFPKVRMNLQISICHCFRDLTNKCNAITLRGD